MERKKIKILKKTAPRLVKLFERGGNSIHKSKKQKEKDYRKRKHKKKEDL